MCNNITNKHLDKNKIKIIKKIIKHNNDNPQLYIQPIQYKDININIIQDGLLLVGTKQRVSKLYFTEFIKKNKNIHTLLYAGSSNGFGALAVAYSAYKLGLKCKVFISGINENTLHSRQVSTLQALNAEIYLCKTFKEARQMEYKYSYYDKKNNIYKDLDGYYTVPMGLKTDRMIELLSEQILNASENTILQTTENLRIWLVSGSGGIAMSIHKAFPNATLFILPTGGGSHKVEVLEWISSTPNIQLVKEELLNNNDANKYYASVHNYDDLIWPYVKKYAKDGDFIWNVGADDIITH